MKVNLVKDTDGKVIATFESAPPGAPSLRPHLKQGHTLHEVQAEPNYTHNIAKFYEQHSK